MRVKGRPTIYLAGTGGAEFRERAALAAGATKRLFSFVDRGVVDKKILPIVRELGFRRPCARSLIIRRVIIEHHA